MTKAELITRMATEASLTRRHAAQVLATFLGQIQAALRRDERVRLAGFGSSVVRWRAARPGRHPRTGQAIIIPARKMPTFRAGKRLRQVVKSPRPVIVVPYEPAWPVTFERLRDVYTAALGPLVRAIEHVG
jgi:DNA-binding protein HU-beta